MRRRFLAFTSAETSEEGGSYLEQRFNTRVPKFFGFRVSRQTSRIFTIPVEVVRGYTVLVRQQEKFFSDWIDRSFGIGIVE